MAEPGKIMKIGRRSTLVKALILLALAGIAIGLVKILPIKAYLGPDHFQRIIGQAGLMGPALLVIFCAFGTCLFIPVTVFVAVGAALFGPYLAFACVCPGALAGAVISYLTARRLGRQFVYPLIGDRLRNYDGLIERNGFKAVLFLRLMFVPFAPVNYGAGLTKVRFWDYFFATALGEVATIFVTTFFIGEIRDIWISGDRGRLFSGKMAFSLGFLIALALVAKLVQRKYESGLAPSLSDSHIPPDDRTQ
ncbi:MAG: TVP38/TMEM64 family protein [Syntrophobacteraceae bacterium]